MNMNSHFPGIVPAADEGPRSEPPPLRPWSEEDEIDLAPAECIEEGENEGDVDRTDEECIEDEDERNLQEERRTFDTPDPDADDPEPR